MRCTLYLDGGSRGNPGPAGAGVLLRDADTNTVLHEAGYFLGKMTNNRAEYQALLRGLELAEAYGAASLTIFSDSELLVRQVTGKYRVKSADLKPLYEEAQRRLYRIGNWQIKHVRRNLNSEADGLANRAMDAGQDVIITESGGSGEERITDGPEDPPAPPGTPGEAPCWVVRVREASKRCPARQASGTDYVFGPTTPEGLCVHAAAAVFAEEPLAWPRSQSRVQTRCERCNAAVHIRRG